MHLVVNNAKKLRGAIDQVGAPSILQMTTSILVVNILDPIVHKRGPLQSRYAILKKVTLTTS